MSETPGQFSSHHQSVLPPYSYEMNRNTGYQNKQSETSRNIDDHLREIRKTSALKTSDRSSEFSNTYHSDYGKSSLNQGYVRPQHDGSSVMSPNHGPPPLPGPVGMPVPFPPGVPPPFYNPAIAPPGLPPFPGPPPTAPGGERSGQSFHLPPPFPPPHNFRADEPQTNFGNIPPPIKPGIVPPPNTALPRNLGPVPSPNNFRTAVASNNFAVPPPSYNFGNAQPQTNFGSDTSHSQGVLSSLSVQPGKSQPSNTVPPGQSKFTTPSPFLDPKSSVKMDVQSCDFGAQQEVNIWLKKKGKLLEGELINSSRSDKADSEARNVSDQKEQGCRSIGQVQNKLRSTLHALAAVQGMLQQLDEPDTMDTQTWESTVQKIKQLQEVYWKAKQELNVKEFMVLKRKLDHRRKKRDGKKRRKQEEKEAKQQLLFERAQKHVAIDQWRDQINQEYLNQQEVKRMKQTADKTLSKVRREIRETRKMLDMVTRLQKLRTIRNDAAEKRGQTFPLSVAEHFQEKTGDLIQLLSQQIEAFEKEEAALKLILETENEEAKEKEKEEKRQKEKEMRQNELDEENCSLFGTEEPSYPGDPMQPFVSFYQQAQYSLHALQSIRHEWDKYLVSENTPMSSRIPDGWISPEPPSSAVWASVLQSTSS